MKTPRMWFLPSGQYQLLITGFECDVPPQQLIIVVPAFGEEMNKSRKLCSDFARAARLEQSVSSSVYLVDLMGCGDSEGLLADATWQIWRDNIADVVAALHTEFPHAALSIVGVRLGAALAIDCCVNELSHIPLKLMLWQPVVNGRGYINQFFRLKIAAMMSAATPLTMDKLRQQLDDNGRIDVCGYEVSLQLVNEIEALSWHQLAPKFNSVAIFWLEVATEQAKLLPVSRKTIALWQHELELSCEAVIGLRFWDTAITVTVPSVVDCTIKFLQGDKSD